jgi:hypothetical protein
VNHWWGARKAWPPEIFTIHLTACHEGKLREKKCQTATRRRHLLAFFPIPFAPASRNHLISTREVNPDWHGNCAQTTNKPSRETLLMRNFFLFIASPSAELLFGIEKWNYSQLKFNSLDLRKTHAVEGGICNVKREARSRQWNHRTTITVGGAPRWRIFIIASPPPPHPLESFSTRNTFYSIVPIIIKFLRVSIFFSLHPLPGERVFMRADGTLLFFISFDYYCCLHNRFISTRARVRGLARVEMLRGSASRVALCFRLSLVIRSSGVPLTRARAFTHRVLFNLWSQLACFYQASCY